MAQLYGQLAGESSPVVTTAVSLAEAICRQVPENFGMVRSRRSMQSYRGQANWFPA